MKHFSTFGFEFTYIPDGHPKDDEERAVSYSDLMRNDFYNHGYNITCYEEEGAIEINSPAFNTTSQLVKFYNVMKKIASNYNIFTYREDSYSGGGHIHVAIPDRIYTKRNYLFSFLRNLYRDIYNRPYIMWIFNEYDDDISAVDISKYNSWIHDEILTNNNEKMLNDTYLKLGYLVNKLTMKNILDIFELPKGYSTIVHPRFDYSGRKTKDMPTTIEFRFFDAQRSLEEALAHYNFINSYLHYIDNITKNDKLIYSERDMKLFQTDYSILEFCDLLVQLKLDWKDYKEFVNRNFERRRKINLLR